MSTVIMAACWPLKLPPTQKAVLISLADNANDAGACWPSIPTICERTCLGRTAVMDAIRGLEAIGYLVADRSNGRHTRYTVTVAQRPLIDPRPVRQADRSPRRTGPAGAPNQSASRTAPVRQADSNRQEPSGTVIQEQRPAPSAPAPGGSKRAPPERLPDPPDWIDPEAWDGFVEMRRRMKKPLTARAAALLFAKLDRFRAAGHCPKTCLDRSTVNGWQDVYTPKPEDTHAAGSAGSGRHAVGVGGRIAELNRRRAVERGDADVIDGECTRVG